MKLIYCIIICILLSSYSNGQTVKFGTKDAAVDYNITDIDSITFRFEENPKYETRAAFVWASSFESDELQAKVFETVEAANFNTVIVSIPPYKNNFGYGNLETFEKFIIEANSKDLSVIAWFANGSRLNPTIEIDFRELEEQATQANWVFSFFDHFSQYLDGVNLDYIRFKHGEDVNLDGKLDGVTETIRKIGDTLRSKFPNVFITADVFGERASREETFKDPPDWEEDVPQWFRDWYSSKTETIYHGPDYVYVPMFMKYQQDPVSWLKNNYLDAILTMNYSTWDNEWQQTHNYYKSFNHFVDNPDDCLIAGLGWVAKSSETSHKGYDSPGVVRKIKYARSIGINNFHVFLFNNHGFDDSPLIEALTIDSEDNEFDAPFENPVNPCWKRQK